MHVPHHSDASLEDAAVIARVLSGDTQQFALLVTRYQTSLYRHAVSMVLDHDVAADMVQETLVRAYTRLSTCREHDRFRAWLFQMLRNRCLDYLKDVRRRNVSLDRALDVPDPAEEPVLQMERARLRGEIARALEQLPDAQREAFLMHYVEELPYETMADLLGASVSALKMRVLRARDALAAALRSRDVTKPSPVRLLFRRTNMKTFFAVAIIALTAGALPVFAQGAQDAQERIDAAMARARSQGVPVSLLENKVAEGKAKGVALDRIAVAIERRETSLERAAQAMKGPDPITDAELSVGADAVDAGVSNAVLKAVTDSAPRERRAVAIAALTELVQRGTAPDAALARVRDALKRGPDALAAVGADRGDGRGSAGGERGGEGRGRGAASGPPANVPAPGGSSQPRKPSNPNAPANPGRGRQ